MHFDFVTGRVGGIKMKKTFRINDEVVEKMENYCREHGKNYTTLVNDAILFYIEHDGEFESVHLENIVELFEERYKDKLEEERKQNKLQLAMIDRNISNTLNLVNSLVVASNLKYCVDISDDRSEIYRKSQDMIKKKIEKRKQHKDNYKG